MNIIKSVLSVMLSVGYMLSQANGQSTTEMGVCYSPFHNPLYGVNNYEAVRGDFEVISKNGYASTVRTYYAKYYDQQVAPIAKEFGLTLYLGVYMENEYYEQDFQSAVEQANKYPDVVKGILIGNENISPVGDKSSSYIKDEIIRMKGLINSTSVLVGTAQRINEWLLEDADMTALINECDIIGAQIYPFFTPGFKIEEPMAMLDAQNLQVQNRVGAENVGKIRITETGWPSAGGSSDQGNEANYENANAFYHGFKNWSGGDKKFYFAMFDRSATQAVPNDKEFERHFGIVDSDYKFKYGTNVPVVTTEAPATDAPATDAPATDAPATDAPATDAPATDAPATDAPATDAPVTDAPATDAPATDAPIADIPTNGPTDMPTDGPYTPSATPSATSVYC